MEVYAYFSELDHKIVYGHVFIGNKSPEDESFAVVSKSFIQFGTKKIYFTKPGEKVFVGKNPSYREYDDIKKEIVLSIFEDVFNLENRTFKVLE